MLGLQAKSKIYGGVTRTRSYIIGCKQISNWKSRHLLTKCKCCGRPINGEMVRGYCVWCANTDKHAQDEIRRENRERYVARMARKRMRDAGKEVS